MQHQSELKAEFEAFLQSHPDCEYVDVLLPDLCNIIRGKRISRDQFDKLYTEGLQIPSSIYLLDVNGNCTDAGGRGFSDGDPDVQIWPVLGSLKPTPWAGPGAAQVMGCLYELDSSPCEVDPRHVLKKVVERFHASGLNPVVALELEFYLLDASSAETNQPTPPVLPETGRQATATQVYSLADLDGFTGFLSEVETICRVQDIPVGATTAEYAVGQYEINLNHVDDPLKAADDAILLQRVIKGIARKHGAVASFMAKPYPDGAGNGLHVHVSILDGDGKNIFNDGSEEGNDQLRHAVAGALELLPESMAIFAPNVNSFRRFAPNLYVPTAATWGYNNRSVALRVPAGSPESKRIEHRVAGADANPYLALAAVLAGVHYGLINQITPPEPRADNAGAELDAQMPFTWQAALDKFSKGDSLSGYLGESYSRLYKECKQTELDAFSQEFTPLEYRWYLSPE